MAPKANQPEAGQSEAGQSEAGAHDAPPAEASVEVASPEDAVLEAGLSGDQARIDELNDKLLRALAEIENVRRRAQKEREDAARYGISAFAKDLLPVCDNLRRALDSVRPEDQQSSETMQVLVEGIELTERELLTAFERHGVCKIEPLDEPFNYDLHQAMFEVENTGKPKGTIVQLAQPGYILNGRLLRPAMVGVAKGDPGDDGPKKVDTVA